MHFSPGGGLNTHSEHFSERRFKKKQTKKPCSSTLALYLQLYKKFKVPGPPKSMDRGKEWNIDLVPKFFLANSEDSALLSEVCLGRCSLF